MFGVPGVERGAASQAVRFNKTTSEAAAAAAQSHVRNIIRPAEDAGFQVRTFVHAWASADSPVARAIEVAYGPNLESSLFEEELREKHHVASMVLSMSATLDLVDAHDNNNKKRSRRSPGVIVMMRHDCYWWHPLQLGGINQLSPLAVVTASWCECNARTAKPAPCAMLDFTKFEGVHDYWLLGRKKGIESFVRSFASRIQANTKGMAMKSLNERAHFALEEHALVTGLVKSKLWLSHPLAISYVHFTLYRWRADRLDRRAVANESRSSGIDSPATTGSSGAPPLLRAITCGNQEEFCYRRDEGAELR